LLSLRKTLVLATQALDVSLIAPLPALSLSAMPEAQPTLYYSTRDSSGIRTRATAVKGRRPRPLNDGARLSNFIDYFFVVLYLYVGV
jgi:hypothetical protein